MTLDTFKILDSTEQHKQLMELELQMFKTGRLYDKTIADFETHPVEAWEDINDTANELVEWLDNIRSQHAEMYQIYIDTQKQEHAEWNQLSENMWTDEDLDIIRNKVSEDFSVTSTFN
jgi:hypothetical protein